MAEILHAEKEIKLKIVYYGPALSGKTTNLIYIHQVLFPNQRVKLFSINTGDDRTLFFDLLPLNLGEINGYKMTLQVFTVPGQVKYDQTRRAVLRKADGVVFVADSQKKELENNKESYENLKNNLAKNNLDYNTIPLVMQYNKQDLADIYSPKELDQLLNERKVPYFGAIAITGAGVIKTLREIIFLVLKEFQKYFPQFEIGEIEERIDKSFEMVLESYHHKKKTKPTKHPEEEFHENLEKTSHNIKVKESRDEIRNEDLVEKAVETNIQFAELSNKFNELKNKLNRKNRELEVIGNINEILLEKKDIKHLPKLIFKSILKTFQTNYGSFLKYEKGNEITEQFINGFQKDPLLTTKITSEETLAHRLIKLEQPYIFTPYSLDAPELLRVKKETFIEPLKKHKIISFMSVPISMDNTPFGLLNIYNVISETGMFDTFDEDSLTFCKRLATLLALAIYKKDILENVINLNEEVEVLVERETSKLKEKISILSEELEKNRIELLKYSNIFLPVVRMERQRFFYAKKLKEEGEKEISKLNSNVNMMERIIPKENENLKRFANLLKNNIEKLEQLFSYIDTKETKYFKSHDFEDEIFNLKDIVISVATPFKKLCEEKGLNLNIKEDSLNHRVKGDREKFKFVINTLLENSYTYTKTGFIEISASFNPAFNSNFIILTVKDTGKGIDKENLGKIFLPYQFKTETMHPGEKSFGISLSLSKEIVEHYGGRIWAKSGTDIGTTMFLEIPVATIQ